MARVTVENGMGYDIFVTFYDRLIVPGVNTDQQIIQDPTDPAHPWSQKRLSNDARADLAVQLDGDGKCGISFVFENVDPTQPTVYYADGIQQVYDGGLIVISITNTTANPPA